MTQILCPLILIQWNCVQFTFIAGYHAQTFFKTFWYVSVFFNIQVFSARLCNKQTCKNQKDCVNLIIDDLVDPAFHFFNVEHI